MRELLAAVPGVIEKGKQVGYEENWKGRGYDTYMLAAPVNYKGNDVYVIALINKDKQSNRYYLHEALDQYGNVIYGQKESSGIASDRPNLSVTDTVADTELPTVTIPQSTDGVKNNRSTENGVDLSAYGLTTKEGVQEAIKAGRITGDTVLGDAGTASASKYVFGKNTLKAEWQVHEGLLPKNSASRKGTGILSGWLHLI